MSKLVIKQHTRDGVPYYKVTVKDLDGNKYGFTMASNYIDAFRSELLANVDIIFLKIEPLMVTIKEDI